MTQSNRSYGAKGSPASSFARYINPRSGAVSSAPTNAPVARLSLCIFISTPHRSSGYPTQANTPHSNTYEIKDFSGLCRNAG